MQDTVEMLKALKTLDLVIADAPEEEKVVLQTTYDRNLKNALYRLLDDHGLMGAKARLAELVGDEAAPLVPRIIAGNKVVKRLAQPTELRSVREGTGLPAYAIAEAVGLSVTKYTNFERGELNELDVKTKKYEKTLAALKRLAKNKDVLEELRTSHRQVVPEAQGGAEPAGRGGGGRQHQRARASAGSPAAGPRPARHHPGADAQPAPPGRGGLTRGGPPAVLS